MNKQIFVNLPVKNLNKSKEFFSALGYTFNPQFTDQNAACMIISDGSIYAMLLMEDFFKTFTSKTIASAHEVTEVLTACHAKAARKSTRWWRKPWPRAARRRANRRITGSCMRMGSRTWTGISGNLRI